jgi:competence protein ComEA
VPEGVTRSQVLVYAAIAVVVVVLGTRYMRSSPAPPPPSAPAARVERSPATAAGPLVHVAGAVRRPGVYRLRPGARIDDAVRQAGGPKPRADLSAVNLAAKAEDGRQVLVPERPPEGAGAAPAPAAASAPAAAGGAGAPAPPLNLNTATLEQLDTLEGIGPSLAQAILDFREENGGFGSVDELAQVPGIGEKRMASLREQVTL